MDKKQFKETKAFRFKRFARKSYSIFNSIHKVVTIGVLSGCTLMSAHAASIDPVEQIFIKTDSESIPPTELDEVVVTASKVRSEEHTSELQSRPHLVCRLLLEKKKNQK